MMRIFIFPALDPSHLPYQYDKATHGHNARRVARSTRTRTRVSKQVFLACMEHDVVYVCMELPTTSLGFANLPVGNSNF